MTFPMYRSIASLILIMGVVTTPLNASENPGKKLLRGASTCLRFAPPSEWKLSGVNQTLMIKVSSQDRFGLSSVSAILSYQNNNTNPVQAFTDELSGSAHLRPSNVRGGASSALIMELNGSSRGVDFADPSKAGVWILHYVLELDPNTLSGSLHGLKEFVPTVFGSAVSKTSRTIENMPVELSNTCAAGGV